MADPTQYSHNGKVYNFPEGTTKEEALAFIDADQPAPKGKPAMSSGVRMHGHVEDQQNAGDTGSWDERLGDLASYGKHILTAMLPAAVPAAGPAFLPTLAARVPQAVAGGVVGGLTHLAGAIAGYPGTGELASLPAAAWAASRMPEQIPPSRLGHALWEGFKQIPGLRGPIEGMTKGWNMIQPVANPSPVSPSTRPTPEWLKASRSMRSSSGSPTTPVPVDINIPPQSAFPSGRVPGTGEPAEPPVRPISPTFPDFEAARNMRSINGPPLPPANTELNIPSPRQFPSGRVPGPIPAPTHIEPVARQAIWEGFEPQPRTELPPVQGAQPGFPSGRVPGHIKPVAPPTVVQPVARQAIWEGQTPAPVEEPLPPVQGAQPGFPSGRIPGHIKPPGPAKVPVAPGTVVPTVEQQAAINETPFTPVTPPTPPQSGATIPNVEGVDREYLEGKDALVGRVAQNQARKAQTISKFMRMNNTEPATVTDPADRLKWAKRAGYERAFSDKTGDSTWKHVMREYEKLR